ncbi:MAG: T9SS type A sorting domain-containing protein [Candidatus Cloacimonetes bacterium]|nr:T9SS type A sorting domain-containing protein [Candidatus Cloacimonadota bacterium]
MKKRLWFTLLLLMSIGLLTGQTWIRWFNFGGLCPGPFDSSRAKLCNVIPAIGGGYLLQGYVELAWGDIPAYEANVFWKLDENGDIIWRKTGGAGSPFVSMVSNGVNRYYCIRTSSGISYLYVFDSEINMIGHYIFHTVNGFSASLYDMQYVEDGLVFAGMVNGGAVVIKTDFQFNVVWQSDIFGIGEALSVEPFGDGWVSMTIREFAEINAVGDTLWTYYDPVDYTSFYDCTVASDNSIYLLGLFKIWKVNTIECSLELIAENVPGGFDTHRKRSIDMLPNGNIVYTGRTSTNQLLHSYSPDGVHQWSRSYDISGPIYFGTGSKNLLVMPDGSILFCMYHNGYVLIKTDSNGNVTAIDDPVAPAPTASIICYPQPAANSVMVSVKSDLVGDLGYSIINVKGQKVYSGKIDGRHREQSFELPNEALDRMPNGIYLISLEQGKRRIAAARLVMIR